MPFTAGPLTSSQARELEQLRRDVAALKAMTATAPMTIERANGVPVLSLKGAVPAASDPEFDAQITARWPPIASAEVSGTNDYLYSWRKVKWVPGGSPIPDPPGPGFNTGGIQIDPSGLSGRWTLKRNWNNRSASPIAIGTVVRIKLMLGSAIWYETDGVGSLASLTLSYVYPASAVGFLASGRTAKITVRDMTIDVLVDQPKGPDFTGAPPDVLEWTVNDNTSLLGP